MLKMYGLNCLVLQLENLFPENVKESLHVNGISISPKKNFCIIKIWNNNSKKEDVKLLSSKLDFLDMNEVKYSSHMENIERDDAKQKKYSSNKKFNKKNINIGRF